MILRLDFNLSDREQQLLVAFAQALRETAQGQGNEHLLVEVPFHQGNVGDPLITRRRKLLPGKKG